MNEHSPSLAETLEHSVKMSLELFNKGELGDSEALCRRILQIQSDQPLALHILGLITSRTDRKEEAVELLSTLVEINPLDSSALTNLGDVLVDVELFDEALISYRKSVEITSNSVDYSYRTGMTYRKMGRSNDAVDALRAALKLDPCHAGAIILLSLILHEQDVCTDAFFKFGDNIEIRLPDTLHQLTPYIIKEQNQWFEVDIGFVPQFIVPGMKAIDIGANFGVYTLSVARALNGTGNVWAFEPASKLAESLKCSIAENGFDGVEVLNAGLSDTAGTAFLSAGRDCETNAIIEEPTIESEEIQVTTLDACMEQLQWQNIDFLKLDAEGHEEKIIKGGEQFFATMSPLIMFEFVDKRVINWDLADTFNAMGFEHFTYLSRLGFLIPFIESENLKPQCVNLFCAKSDTIKMLERRQLLASVRSLDDCDATFPTIAGWQDQIRSMPYYHSIFGDAPLEGAVKTGADGESYMHALEFLVMAETKTLSPATRYKSLLESRTILCSMAADGTASIPRLITLCRIYSNLEDISNVNKTIGCILSLHEQGNELLIDEPFMPVVHAYDEHVLDNKEDVSAWALAQVLEKKVTSRHYSSYFTGTESLPDLTRIESTGFMSDVMKTMKILIQTRFTLS